jgi:hypothetical protein
MCMEAPHKRRMDSVRHSGYGYRMSAFANSSARTHSRPYWHVDAKWISGLAMTAALGAALLLFAMASLTRPDRAVELSATLVASFFSKDGLDAPIDTTQLQQRLAASPTGTVAPLDGFPTATITKADLSLSPRELRLKIFRQIAQPVYDLGVDGAAKQFSSDPKQQEQFAKSASFLAVLTRKTHDTLLRDGQIGLGVAALFLAGVVFFSARWGRLANPGLLLVVTGLPGAIAGSVLGRAGSGMKLGPLPSDVVPAVGQAMQVVYLPAIEVGVGLVVIAGIGRVVSGMRKRA